MPKSVLHELRAVADTNNNLIDDVSSGGTFTFAGRSDVYCLSVAAGTKKLPDAGIGTKATFKAAGSVTLTNSAGTTVATLSSGQLVTCFVSSRTNAGVSTWTAYSGNASGITVSDTSNRTTQTTAEAWLNELAGNQRYIEVDLSRGILAAGTPLAAFADNAGAPAPGITLANSKAVGIRWNNQATQNAPVWFNVPFPYTGFDDAAGFAPTVYVLASKTGATSGDATTFTITSFSQKVGSLHDSESDAISDVTSAMTGNATAKTIQQVSTTYTELSGGTLPKVVSLSITPTSGTLGTDDVIIHRLWMTY